MCSSPTLQPLDQSLPTDKSRYAKIIATLGPATESETQKPTVQDASDDLRRRKWCVSGTWLVITDLLAGDIIVDTLQLRQVD